MTFREGAIFLIITGLTLLYGSCTFNKSIQPFKSDGCSLFPDRSLVNKENWCECCYEHDLAYWKGGTAEERDNADKLLKQCILDKTQDTALANMMYIGVRFGGSPYFPTWYRWGYGWNYQRGYAPLTSEEEELVSLRIAEVKNTVNDSLKKNCN